MAKKKIYKAYNRLYRNNRPVTNIYLVDTGSNKALLKAKVTRYNTKWNKQSLKSKAKLVKIV